MKYTLMIRLFVLATVFPILSFAQEQRIVSYSIENKTHESIMFGAQPQIMATDFQIFKLDIEGLKNQLDGIAYREGALNGFVGIIELPHTDGTTRSYKAKRNQTLHPDLNAKYPDIITLDAYATDGSGARGKWDITPHGLHAMIFIPGESTLLIDPYIKGNTEYYIVYRKKDFITDKVFECLFTETESSQEPDNTEFMLTYGSCELRTYRLALAATAEYSIFHGGTKALAAAAQATSMNRVNGVYEKDIAVTMTIIPNNDTLIYLSNPDPYSNGQASTMLNQNQTNVNNLIGSANYDIGHVFGTNSGGVAGLGVICNNNSKARGVTGSGSPINDPFDIDYVAHEMGHQFGANHTQNNPCNSVSAARHEPGSASTIMGYAGICSPNVQSNSDDYFHGHSLGEIGNRLLSTSCAQITTLNNVAPLITSSTSNINIPISTPFALTTSAYDPDGDVITYLWEQMNNQQSTQPPVATATGGPNFRSWDPDTLPTRYFPRLSALANNGPFTWEVLPSVGRTMNFRVSVFDNHESGSCNDFVNMTVATIASAGPFVLNYPSNSGISWAGGSTQTITWNVANTDVAPVSCDSVQILLSTDGGMSYPTIISGATLNDGSEIITVPNMGTTTARIMVMSKAGTFFDISDNNFSIVACNQAGVPVVAGGQTICFGESATLSVVSGTLNDSQYWEWYAGQCSGTPAGIGTTISVSPMATTTYYATGGGGCPGVACASVTVVVTPFINTFVLQIGAQLSANQTGVQYQWVDCNNNFSPIIGATNQSFTPSALTGSYAVILTNGNCSDTSDCYFVDQSSIGEYSSEYFTIYPNPFSNELVLSWEKVDIQYLELLDVSGRVIEKHAPAKSNQHKLQTAQLSAGVYFIRLVGSEGMWTERVVKQ